MADPTATLLTACEKGYGKRTAFGPNSDENAADTDEDSVSSGSRYRTQNRGGKGLRDIKTTKRNGKVIGIKSVNDEDELLLMTSRGKIQRIKCVDISTIGRNTQGVRIMGLDDDDSLAVIARVPRDELGDDELLEPASGDPTGPAPSVADVPASPNVPASPESQPEPEGDAE